MKILFIQKEGGIFGAENYHLAIIPALQRYGIKIDFLRLYTDYQLGKDSEFVKRLERLGVLVYQVNIGRLPGIQDLRQVAAIVKKGRYDIVHSHLIHADLYAALVKKFFRVRSKFVSTKHGYDNAYTARYGFDPAFQKRTPYFLISRWAESIMDRSYTISKGLLDFFYATGLSSPQKMELIYYGFDVPPAEEPSGSENYRRSDHQLCIAGRLVEFKGHAWALQALKILVREYPDCKLVILGTGAYENILREKVDELQLTDHVDFLGYRKDVSHWMKYSDVVIVPSRSEGFGVVFLEAFNARTPVVAFDVPAANELIEDQVSGVLVKPYSVEEMARKISLLLNDRPMAKRYSERAYTLAKERFSVRVMVDQTYSFYNRVLKS